MSSKHTQGPWKMEQRGDQLGVWGPNDQRVFSVFKGVVPGNADARLITSSPDLLEALERCESLLSSITDIRSDLAEFQDHYLRQARAAIAKARGES